MDDAELRALQSRGTIPVTEAPADTCNWCGDPYEDCLFSQMAHSDGGNWADGSDYHDRLQSDGPTRSHALEEAWCNRYDDECWHYVDEEVWARDFDVREYDGHWYVFSDY